MTAPAPAALRPPPGHPRFPALDGLRAIAALAVVAVHWSAFTTVLRDSPIGAYTARLNVGVTIFFVLSGFLLYRPFAAAAISEARPVVLGDYARRRALRILPAYWVALTILAIALSLPGVFTGDWWRYYGLAQIYFSDSVMGGIWPAWSLCIEVTFYAVLPLYALALARLHRHVPARRAIALELAVLAVLSAAVLAFRTVLFARPGPDLAASTLLGTFDWFAAGMALAVLSVAAQARPRALRVVTAVQRRPWLAWAIAGALYWVVATRIGAPRGYDPAAYSATAWFWEHVLYGVIALLVVAPAVFDPGRGVVRRVLTAPVAAWLGLISYGIFLWHFPLMTEMVRSGVDTPLELAVAGFAAAILAGALSYYAVERPALRFKERRRRPAPAIIPAHEPAP
jgi:peptidoglycan/LPS O-acetylase OafA/YrhL